MCEYCNINGNKKEFSTKLISLSNTSYKLHSYISLTIENSNIIPVYTDSINIACADDICAYGYPDPNALIVNRKIKFCPMCGQNLEDLIANLSSNDSSEEEK
jgi:hypothetical protein